MEQDILIVLDQYKNKDIDEDFGNFFSSAGGNPFGSFFKKAQEGKKKKK